MWCGLGLRSEGMEMGVMEVGGTGGCTGLGLLGSEGATMAASPLFFLVWRGVFRPRLGRLRLVGCEVDGSS